MEKQLGIETYKNFSHKLREFMSVGVVVQLIESSRKWCWGWNTQLTDHDDDDDDGDGVGDDVCDDGAGDDGGGDDVCDNQHYSDNILKLQQQLWFAYVILICLWESPGWVSNVHGRHFCYFSNDETD